MISRIVEISRGKTARLTLDRLDKFIVPDPNSGCWIWAGSRNLRGYGRLTLYGGASKKTFWAHRLVYEFYRGSIPIGLHLDHLCKTPACVNPAHLEPVTPKENALRVAEPFDVGRANRSKTHCPSGHEYSAINTKRYKNKMGHTSRTCQTCAILRARRARFFRRMT